MREPIDLIESWRRLPKGSPAVLATVVATQGSTYRRPGARMLLTPDGWAAGSISGGCLEGDVVRTAWERTANGPALVTYDASSDDDIVWGFGLGCNGVVQALLERIPEDGGPLAFLAECFEQRRMGYMATVVEEGPDLGRRQTATDLADWPEAWRRPGLHGSVFVEHLHPPRSLVVFGAGHDAIPLVALAKSLGWHVTVVDGRTAYARTDRFPGADAVIHTGPHQIGEDLKLEPGAAAVVMTHNFLHDAELLRRLLPSPVGYIGLLGPARRAQRLLAEADLAPTRESLARLHAPIGHDLGAEGPDEIALAIVAEIQAFFTGRSGGSLRGIDRPLHEGETILVSARQKENPTCAVST